MECYLWFRFSFQRTPIYLYIYIYIYIVFFIEIKFIIYTVFTITILCINFYLSRVAQILNLHCAVFNVRKYYLLFTLILFYVNSIIDTDIGQDFDEYASCFLSFFFFFSLLFIRSVSYSFLLFCGCSKKKIKQIFNTAKKILRFRSVYLSYFRFLLLFCFSFL